LGDIQAFQAVSYATASPEGADAGLLGTGTQGASYSGTGVLTYETRAGFSFDMANAGELKLGTFGSTGFGTGLSLLELTVSNNGSELFTRSFSSLAEAQLFFTDATFALGSLAAGHQDLLLTASYTFAGAGGLAFDYGFAVTAVPEPGTWMLLLGGLALLAARQHRQRERESAHSA
ncbi:MAG TPA: PEP-CTERM sorting domain-containing protein, partial [Pseudoduganella sp.]